LEAAIDAAEHYMRALKLATVPKDKNSLDAKCKELLARAEKIKENKDAGDKHQRRPTRKLTTREEIVLLEGAKLHGFIFPPWTFPPDSDEFELNNEEELFTYVKDSGTNARGSCRVYTF
jgi:calpain-7